MKIADLQSRPHEHKLRISFYTTLAAAVVLLPLWFWNAGNINVDSRSQASADIGQVASQISGGLDEVGNPVVKVGEGLQQSFSAPVNITSAETKDGNLLVYFQITNSTFADLAIPVSRSVLSSVATPDSIILLQKAVSDEGKQFVPLVPAGETRSGVLYFSQVLNGSYNIKFTGLQYQGGDQNEFEQSASFEVKDSWKPRS